MKKNYFKNLMQVSLLLGAAFVISSCDDVIGQEDNPVASYVQWKAKTPEAVTLKIGNTYTVQATAVSSAIIVYESENPEIAKVDPVTGEITAVGVGETNINAVISGASSAGKSVFVPEKISIKVIVKDGKAKLTRVKDEVVEYTANKDSVIDLSKLFTAYPEATTEGEKDKSTIEYVVKYLDKKAETDDKFVSYKDDVLGSLTGSKFKVGNDIKKYNNKKAINDTLYAIATITNVNGSEYELPAKDANQDIVMDTVKIIINKSIAYINKEGKREILTADKFKELPASTTIEAGTYYVKNEEELVAINEFQVKKIYAPAIAVKGNVTLIIADNKNINFSSISDQTDKSTLNIFGEAVKDGKAGKYKAANPKITVNASDNGDAISNFAEINLYAGTFRASTEKANCGAIVNVKNLNVNGTAELEAINNSTSGYAISLLEGGKLTVNGGSVTAVGKGSDTKVSFAIIGDVDIKNGSNFEARSDHRAVKGKITKGDKVKLYNAEKKEITENDSSKVITTVAPEKEDK